MSFHIFVVIINLSCTYTYFQNHRGRATNVEQWVFGLVDTAHESALGYIELVPRGDAATLLSIIQAHVYRNTTIFSDEWSAYNRVQMSSTMRQLTTPSTLWTLQQGYTQNVESYWNRVKGKFERMKVHLHQLPSYLDEFMWRERQGRTTSLAFNTIITHYCPIPRIQTEHTN